MSKKFGAGLPKIRIPQPTPRQTAIGLDCKSSKFSWVRPLSDPIGGPFCAWKASSQDDRTRGGRDAPEEILQILLGSLQFSDACLRMYGHPDLLRIAEAINGEDFVPFNERFG